jgi:hypothetical protein
MVGALVCLVLLAGLCSASATELVLGTSSTGTVQFTNVAGTVDMSFTGCGGSCLEGFGYFGAVVGTYEFTLTGTPTLGAPTTGIYPINMNGSVIDFTWTSQDLSLFLDGSVTLDNVTDGTQAPRFIGSMQITNSDLPGYAAGGNSPLDFIVYLGTNPSIDFVYNNPGSSTQGYLSAGEIGGSTPEPSSIALFGSGVAGVVAVLRRRKISG